MESQQRPQSKTLELHIALQDGFMGEPVTVTVDDEVVFSGPSVRTRFQIGLAHSFEVPIAPGSVKVEVFLPARKLEDRITVKASEHIYVGISVNQNDRIEFKTSRKPFGYL